MISRYGRVVTDANVISETSFWYVSGVSDSRNIHPGKIAVVSRPALVGRWNWGVFRH
jgi:hypothetical protein